MRGLCSITLTSANNLHDHRNANKMNGIVTAVQQVNLLNQLHADEQMRDDNQQKIGVDMFSCFSLSRH
jgi:hypothetical protein